jgi:hypothetical protein
MRRAAGHRICNQPYQLTEIVSSAPKIGVLLFLLRDAVDVSNGILMEKN